jgi:hypothetical protein
MSSKKKGTERGPGQCQEGTRKRTGVGTGEGTEAGTCRVKKRNRKRTGTGKGTMNKDEKLE